MGMPQTRFSFYDERFRKAPRTFTERENCSRVKLIHLVFSLSRKILHDVIFFCVKEKETLPSAHSFIFED